MVPPGSPSGIRNPQEDVWVVDSACTHHKAAGKGNFNVTDAGRDDPVTLAAGETVAADGLGTATLFADGAKVPVNMTLNDAFHVPGMKENLVSVGMVDDAGGAVLFAKGAFYVYGDADVPAVPDVLAKAHAVSKKTNGQP
ncbi:hypothetical protein I4F81_011342 [Pyropia yezoensis]|uniref:Uncharacterized protein n=2 Tax=Pyropia yezoensis TaxID=2788 RepID=A0ACC3CF77_PYRYE|nr:hypothetical protein I4F81_011341 [Neopyropia yezoensis]KAK1868860.1 hypothetical protein I4F81_011342 [Neopyropia yezoensis]